MFTITCFDVIGQLIPMDTDNDGIPDTEIVTLSASAFDAGTSLNCSDSFIVAFDVSGMNLSQTFDCSDLGTQLIDIYFISDGGIIDSCQSNLVIQDNNDVDICP